MSRKTNPKDRPVNWSLYLVTDSTPAILGDKDILHIVEEAIHGGVGVVQYREKHADTGAMVDVAAKLHTITQKYNVPLLINDRVDVCMAVGAEGVHIGQDDMEVARARQLLGPDAIIGVTASSPEEADKAIQDGADYLGIGTTFATPTKTDTKHIIGTRGLQQILATCDTGSKKSIPCVAIGSINASNVQRVLHQSASGSNRLNGVAVVSAIMASTDPRTSASILLGSITSAPAKFYTAVPPHRLPVTTDLKTLIAQVPDIIKAHTTSGVICHNMTNTVVQNFVANVCLGTGSSPIMSENAAEAADLAKLGGALVINMGTITPDKMEAYIAGMRAYNAAGQPVLFDPVGGGATAVRRAAIERLLAEGFFSVIKGNEGEIGAVAGTSTMQQRGVDSGPSDSSDAQKAQLVEELARREHCIVLMTGKTDYLSDGTRTVAIRNGSNWLSKITGSGCALGAVIASYLAVHRDDKFLAALAGILHFELAAEEAEGFCGGPGTFIPRFLDQLSRMGRDLLPEMGTVKPEDFVSRVKVEMVS
ncbi:hydroxyethylthiazole kinase [Fonsecaea erecta]|uniref:Hydroxyethylthiazole kinase n=1 Tax=Fonsecaea erecta TaxID=1367422 RepID=A0A178Z4T9_9EURO|nr:hydroxyethylthiazole kinase [Fonsecaea erecta]OAP54778.1 hydroxyethylthiazole kinase [Fonsecaea erecta]